MNNIKTDIDKSLNTISDIYWRGRPSNTVVHSSLSSEKNALTSFNSKIENYERKNYVAANGELKALLEALKRTIAMYSSSTRSVVSYNSGDIYNEPLALDLNKKVQASAEYIQKNQKEIEQAYAKQQEVMAQMQKDYEEACKAREDEGWAKLIAGGALAVTAIGLMVFSGGMATPLVVAGVCTAAYGISNSVEGVHDVRRGKIGDLDGVALNPIRDTIFMGNQTAYDVWGQVSSIVFFVGRPVASSVSSVAGSSLGVMGKTAAKSLAINLAIGGGSSFASNVATNHIAEKFNLNKTETTLLNIGMHIGLVYGARGVAKILKGKLFGKQDSVNIEDNGGHEAKIPRTGSEWNEYFKSKYGSENVEWHSKLTEGEVNTWSKTIRGTQDIIPGTNIPKSFVMEGTMVNGKEVWVHGNATKHMGEFVNSAKGSILVENELMASFQNSVKQILPNVNSGKNFFNNINGWEIGINGDTGVIYHALYRGGK